MISNINQKVHVSKSNVFLLTLPEIAAWQIENVPGFTKIDPDCRAELPALQRGAVWKAGQIEALWDSILQGFPLGAFLLTPFDENLGTQKFKLRSGAQINKDSDSANPPHMLLDGQQRATSIALGFLNPWTEQAVDVPSVLWIDLAPPHLDQDARFTLRVVTHAHPWGYRLKDPSKRNSQEQIRQSLQAFRAASAPNLQSKKPHEIPLTAVWPWDAGAPVPMALLIQALYAAGGNIEKAKAAAKDALATIPFMKDVSSTDNSPNAITYWTDRRERVAQAFDSSNGVSQKWLDYLLGVLWERLNNYVVPVSVVPTSALNPGNVSNAATVDSTQQSPVETLFIRVNSAGTPLVGEELMYSLIKSAWTDAPNAIGQLTHKLATPARIALLVSRLVRARNQRKKWAESDENPKKSTVANELKLIASPAVEEFRRLMHGQNDEHPSFASDLKEYIVNDGLKVFKQAHKLLTKGTYGLPPVLANELAQKSPDVFFLFLCWLDRALETGVEIENIQNENSAARRRLLGFLTALAWFSNTENKHRAVGAVWHSLQTMNARNLSNFFNSQRFQKTMAIDEQGKQHMIPVIHPDVLMTALKKCILGHPGCQDTISRSDSLIWTDWKKWSWLIDSWRPRDISEALAVYPSIAPINGETPQEHIRDVWEKFINSIWSNRSILLYAQRDWINDWFSDFDPSLPEYLEDKNRPWDYDHIYPQRYLQGTNGGTLQGLPRLIKDWHGSIGNLRAWPLEANRSDGDEPPATKLVSASPEEGLYSITEANKLDASFIRKDDFDNYWRNCHPAGGNRLNQQATFPARQVLVKAIVWRFIAIYRKWYEDLKIDSLMTPPGH